MLELLLVRVALEPGVSLLAGLLEWRPTFPEVPVMGELLDVASAEDLLFPAVWLSLVPAASNSFSFLLRRFFLISAL